MNKVLNFVIVILIFWNHNIYAQVNVDVNLNVNHKIDTITSFDRSKFITIHADVLSSDWDLGTNTIADTRADFLEGYDVYLGRNTGPITGDLRNAPQSPTRPGFVDPDYYTDRSTFWKDYYASETSWHQYDDRNNLIVCPQLHPFWPDGTNLTNGWSLSQIDNPNEPFGTASGEYLANYVKQVYGTGGIDGQKKPTLIEIVNEPMFELVDWKGESTPDKIIEFHKTVAQIVKDLNPDVKVGGYVTAFPEFDKNNFSQWEQRWKKFIDVGGDDIDFYSLHLYDLPVFGGKMILRKGGDIEATFDMLEHYSYLKFGKPKSFVISEYGATVHDYQGPWSSYRDWLRIKAHNSMMLQFMERPDLIDQTINFTMLKVDWWSPNTNGTTDHTWPDRLFRKANEPTSYTGDWVYTEMIHFFELWKNVKGKRVDSWSASLDVMTDSFIDGNKAYVIINNLGFEEEIISLDLKEENGLTINSLNVKQLFLGETNPIKDRNTIQLSNQDFTSNFPKEFTLKPEGTYVLEYTYSDDINVDETSTEEKHYADKYYQPIVSGMANTFQINGVTKGNFGEAVLRIGVGRSHDFSLEPTIFVNNTEIDFPNNFRGGPQTDRASFFGVLEVNVPYELLKTNNEISVTFQENGGYISSLTLQAFEFSKEIIRNTSILSTTDIGFEEDILTIYPNPVQNSLTIIGKDQFENINFYDLSGKQLLSSQRNNKSIDVSALAAGVYIIELTNSNKQKISKLLVKR